MLPRASGRFSETTHWLSPFMGRIQCKETGTRNTEIIYHTSGSSGWKVNQSPDGLMVARLSPSPLPTTDPKVGGREGKRALKGREDV